MIQFVGLGDSFTSGEGVPGYFPGTDTQANQCHRSTNAYSRHIDRPGHTEALFDLSRDNSSGFRWDFLACSGATTSNVRSAGTARYGEPPQLNRIEIGSATDMVALTIGGNDAGFAPILELCGLPIIDCSSVSYKPLAPQDNRSLNEIITSLIDGLQGRLAQTYSEVRAKSPDATVFVLGYPNLFPASVRFWDPACAALMGFYSGQERSFFRDLASQLNGVIAAAAAQAGVHFVPVADYFDGHEVCGTDDQDWIFGPRWPVAGSFHPNPDGQWHYAEALDQYIAGYVGPKKPNGLPYNPSTLRASRRRDAEPPVALPSLADLAVEPEASASCLSGDVYVPGQTIRLSGDGFAPDSTVSLGLTPSADGALWGLGNTTADATGHIDAFVPIPPGTPAGGNAVVQALGLDEIGAPRLLVATIALSGSFGSDSDADGRPNVCDNCPTAANLDQADSNGDGIGDACEIFRDGFDSGDAGYWSSTMP